MQFWMCLCLSYVVVTVLNILQAFLNMVFVCVYLQKCVLSWIHSVQFCKECRKQVICRSLHIWLNLFCPTAVVWKDQTLLLVTECWWKPHTTPTCHSSGMPLGSRSCPWQVLPLCGPRLALAKASVLPRRIVTMQFLLQVGFCCFCRDVLYRWNYMCISAHDRTNFL